MPTLEVHEGATVLTSHVLPIRNALAITTSSSSTLSIFSCIHSLSACEENPNANLKNPNANDRLVGNTIAADTVDALTQTNPFDAICPMSTIPICGRLPRGRKCNFRIGQLSSTGLLLA